MSRSTLFGTFTVSGSDRDVLPTPYISFPTSRSASVPHTRSNHLVRITLLIWLLS